MSDSASSVRFFMGANTPDGFLGFPEDWYDPEEGWSVWLIKSGPGTGKSSLMRKVGNAMLAAGARTEWICCSSDPLSLDGVRFPDQKLCLLDATAPHVMEPRFWCACEQILPLATCADVEALHTRLPEIMDAIRRNQAAHTRCRKYLSTAGALLQNNHRAALPFTDTAKIARAAASIAKREFLPGNGAAGRTLHRFLSAATPEGYLTFYDTLQALCPRIYSLEDDYGSAAHLLLSALREKAEAAGWETIVCPCPLYPAYTEHLLVPGAGVGFTVSDPLHKVDFPVYRRVHAARFMDAEGLRTKRQTMSFNRRSIREMLNEAVSASHEAKAIHDEIEKYYISAMDFSAVDRMTEDITTRFLSSLTCANPA